MRTEYYYALEDNGRRSIAIPFGISEPGYAFTLYAYQAIGVRDFESWMRYVASFKGDFVVNNGDFEYVSDREVLRSVFQPTPLKESDRPRVKIDEWTGLALPEEIGFFKEHCRSTWVLHEGAPEHVLQAPCL
jgi:hypothetical protein